MHQTIESDDELISETVEGVDGANASRLPPRPL